MNKDVQNGNTGIVPVTGTDVVALPELKDLFSKWTIQGIESWDSVSKLGISNIKKLIANLRDSEGSSSSRIKSLYEKRKMLNNASREKFIKLSENYNGMPSPFPQSGKRPNSWGDDLEPLGAEAETREHDSTTFTICGWCEHRGGGSCRFKYMISGGCSFFNEQPERDYDSFKWDTPCRLRTMSESDFESMVQNIDKDIEKEKTKREGIRTAISYMQGVLKNVKVDKPYLMSLKPYDYFNVGDSLIVYLGRFEDKTVEGNWIKADCIFGYRHQDGCVSYQTVFPIHTNLSNYEGRGGGAGTGRPEVMKDTDFAYLSKAYQDDLEFLKIWVANINDMEGFKAQSERDSFLEDFKDPFMAKPPKDWTPPTDEIKVDNVKDALSILCMLMEPENKKDLDNWVKLQLQYVHPDKFSQDDTVMQDYAHRQTRAIYAARDLLQARIDNKK